MPATPSSSSAPSRPARVARSRRHVQAWRKLRGLTQSQLADRAGVDRKSLMRVERGDGGVSLRVVLRVLHALGVLDGLPRRSTRTRPTSGACGPTNNCRTASARAS